MPKNLVLVHQPRYQARADWHEIADHVRGLAPDIIVFVVNNEEDDGKVKDRLTEHPTLVFSPVRLREFRPPRGKVYQGVHISRRQQLERLHAARVLVPPTIMLGPKTTLDPSIWGELVVVKPSALKGSSKGAGVTLMRTRDVRYRPPESYPPDHPGRYGPMLVQGFVYTGRNVANIRVLTLFGEPLYAVEARSRLETIDLDRRNRGPRIVASQSIPTELKDLRFIDDERVLKLARNAYAAMPEAALQGVDILKEKHTGRLFVLEVNPGGNTWHFSSSHYRRQALARGAEIARKRKEQFDAFRTAAEVLVNRVRAEAE